MVSLTHVHVDISNKLMMATFVKIEVLEYRTKCLLSTLLTLPYFQYEAFCLHMSCEEVKEAAMALTDLYASLTYSSTCACICLYLASLLMCGVFRSFAVNVHDVSVCSGSMHFHVRLSCSPV